MTLISGIHFPTNREEPTIHQDTANRRPSPGHSYAGTDHGIRELVPEPGGKREPRGARGGDSKKESRAHAASSQYQRHLDRSTSAGTATGISQSR
jgi:hypothetical protein